MKDKLKAGWSVCKSKCTKDNAIIAVEFVIGATASVATYLLIAYAAKNERLPWESK